MRILTYENLSGAVNSNYTQISPGLRFGLFFNGWDDRKLELEKNKLTPMQSVCLLSNDSKQLLDGIKTREAYLQESNADHLRSVIFDKTVYSQAPFVTGMGLQHPMENGFSFLNPYGLPYLPGSSVKGVVRRAAEELSLFASNNCGWDIVTVWWLFGFDATSAYFEQDDDNKVPEPVKRERERWREAYRACIERCDSKHIIALINTLPEKEEKKKSLTDNPSGFLKGLQNKQAKEIRRALHIKGSLRFWDVIPKLAGDSLRVDIMNPHYSHYYQDNQPPGDWGSPNPIFFLTVPAGSSFRFIVEYNSIGGMPEELNKNVAEGCVQKAMEFAFDWLGFGAKTSIGYGRMVEKQPPVSNVDPVSQVSSRQRSEATHGQHRPRYEKTHKNEAPQVHKQTTVKVKPKPQQKVQQSSNIEIVELIKLLQGDKAMVKTKKGEEITCTGLPSYGGVSNPGERFKATVEYEGTKPIKAKFKAKI